MPKEFLKKYMPDAEKIKQHKSLQFLGARLHEPNLWHLNRRSVAMAFAIGLFCAWIPTPTQMAIAAMAALYFRANLPISVGLVWITNPITMPPLFYFAYRVGLWVMGRPSPANDFEFSIDGLLNGLGGIWAPFLLGCLIVGIICAGAGYFGINYFWRKNIAHRWWRRQQLRAGIAVPDAVNPVIKVTDFLQTWFSAHPEIKQSLQPVSTKSLALIGIMLKQSKMLLQTGLKQILDFVPFN
ncbi:MAG: DUF2062 domain-containing protein [Methylococcales bacterium]